MVSDKSLNGGWFLFKLVEEGLTNDLLKFLELSLQDGSWNCASIWWLSHLKYQRRKPSLTLLYSSNTDSVRRCFCLFNLAFHRQHEWALVIRGCCFTKWTLGDASPVNLCKSRSTTELDLCVCVNADDENKAAQKRRRKKQPNSSAFRTQ